MKNTAANSKPGKRFNAEMQRMKIDSTKVVGSTRLRRVQFGGTPNCGGTRLTGYVQPNDCNVNSPQVSGATPETTRGTRALPHSQHLCIEKWDTND
jgi:hypothetical protein